MNPIPHPDCVAARTSLTARLYEPLPAGEAKQLEQHLDGCAPCRREPVELEALVDQLERSTPPPPAWLEAAVFSHCPPQALAPPRKKPPNLPHSDHPALAPSLLGLGGLLPPLAALWLGDATASIWGPMASAWLLPLPGSTTGWAFLNLGLVGLLGSLTVLFSAPLLIKSHSPQTRR